MQPAGADKVATMAGVVEEAEEAVAVVAATREAVVLGECDKGA